MLPVRKNCVSYFLFLICLLSMASCSYTGAAAHADNNKENCFESLQRRLADDGFDKKKIEKLYSGKEVSFDTKGVSLYFVHSESKLNYDQFLEDSNIRNAKAYMEAHKSEFAAAEKAFGVDGKVIAAILLVETKLGNYLGNRLVFNTLSSMASLADQDMRNMLWARISRTTQLSKEEFEEKAERKSGWAYEELKAFLKYADKESINPLGIVGSYAGAMGLCQFMPSNISTLAKDGNSDGRIDLFEPADAIMSIANYLSNYGWYAGIDAKAAYDVVYHYNHSSYYVNTILKIAELLKG
jgi:membrane-bound lytic murein transglycosylase B